MKRGRYGGSLMLLEGGSAGWRGGEHLDGMVAGCSGGAIHGGRKGR
jgi:hypothetical protein